ncbi:hypothetical protein PGTUg99_023690 [Puccinia graminis f. sp. tritici]|uniref:Uncharacterized protein n=1 Tax=Puccinia graminis f. sp. tritici TaxID=56615 RepID=A0A5B0RER1_PUCGR|nr:hypothetical protein PGTUg99_023690 [Puccinia graminis f. sp. tritici]
MIQKKNPSFFGIGFLLLACLPQGSSIFAHPLEEIFQGHDVLQAGQDNPHGLLTNHLSTEPRDSQQVPSSIEPQRSEQDPSIQKQLIVDNEWLNQSGFRHSHPGLPAGNLPDIIEAPVSDQEPNGLHNQHSAGMISSAISSPSDHHQIRVEDYLEQGLVEFAANEYPSQLQHFLFQSPTIPPNSPTLTTLASESNPSWENQPFGSASSFLGGHASMDRSPKMHEEPNKDDRVPRKRQSFDHERLTPQHPKKSKKTSMKKDGSITQEPSFSIINSADNYLTPSSTLQRLERKPAIKYEKIIGANRQSWKLVDLTQTKAILDVPEHSTIMNGKPEWERVTRLDIFGLDLKPYGYVHTLKFPGERRWKKNDFLETDVLHKSGFWRSLATTNRDLPVLVQEAINPSVSPLHKTLEKSRNLLEEIFFRDGQFLLALTSKSKSKNDLHTQQQQKEEGTVDIKDESKRSQLRSHQQHQLLEWLIKLFGIGMGSPTLLFEMFELDQPYDSDDQLIRFQEMLYEYLRIEEPKSEYMICNLNPISPHEQRKVSHAGALKTQVALNALGIYYKYSNRAQWEMMFESDADFVNFFGFLKIYEINRMAHRVFGYFSQWAALSFFPWELRKLDFGRMVVGGGDRDSRAIDNGLQRFRRVAQNPRWKNLEKHFVELRLVHHDQLLIQAITPATNLMFCSQP